MITRKIDELGRVVLPKELLTALGMKKGDAVDFVAEEQRLVMEKHKKRCVFCGSEDVVVDLEDRSVSSTQTTLRSLFVDANYTLFALTKNVKVSHVPLHLLYPRKCRTSASFSGNPAKVSHALLHLLFPKKRWR